VSESPFRLRTTLGIACTGAIALAACGGSAQPLALHDASGPSVDGSGSPETATNPGIADIPDGSAQPADAISSGPSPQEGIDPDLSQCPGTEPVIGASCAAEGVVCTYGDSVRVDCRRARGCVMGTWIMDPSEDCRQPPANYCPAQVPADSCSAVTWTGMTIPTNGQAVCAYPDGTSCVCNICQGLGCSGQAWLCVSPPTNPACPAIAPNLGAKCPSQGLECDYGICGQGGGQFICRKTVWYPLRTGCQG
jgi:hypothetical protein